MCEFSRKLTAHLDRELPKHESEAVERHLEHCSECRSEFATLKQTTAMIEAYCEAAMARTVPRRTPRWALSVSGIATGAIAAAMAFVIWHARAQRPAAELPPPIPSAMVAPANQQTAPAHITARRIRKRLRDKPAASGLPSRGEAISWTATEPVVRIAIPAEAVFPPGAVPPGVSFNADLTIGPDGSAQWIIVRP